MWLSHRPALVLAQIFLGKLGEQDTLGLTLVQITNISTYFMHFSCSPSPGGKDATYKSYSCNLTFPAIPQEHSHRLCPEPPPSTTGCTRLLKRFLWSLSCYWREQSLTPSPIQTLSKLHTKNAAISCWCACFLYIIGAEVLQVAMLLAFCIYACYIWPVPTELKSLTEYWNYPIKKKKFSSWNWYYKPSFPTTCLACLWSIHVPLHMVESH